MRETEIDARLRALPPIRRARFWRLYAENGRRYLDFWQDGGRGILGARHAKLGLGLKESLDRGLDRPLPSRLEARLAKSALALVPGMTSIRFFRDEGRALAALSSLRDENDMGKRGRGAIASGEGLLDSPLVFDPARIGPSTVDATPLAGLHRLFAAWLPESSSSAASFPISIPLLPLPRALGPTIILFADEDLAAKAGPGDLLAPLALRAALDALTALVAYESKVDETHWRRIDKRIRRLFDRCGPWLFPKPGISDWKGIFDAALERGLLLSPDPGLPSLVPGDFDDGEVARFVDLVP